MDSIQLNFTESLEKLKNLFKKKEKYSVGVDIGTNSIKVVMLERKDNNIFLRNYAMVKSKDELLKAGTKGLVNDETGVVVREIFEKAGIDFKKINISVPGFVSLIATVDLPTMPEDELDSVVNMEAPKYIPAPMSEVIFGWQVIEGTFAKVGKGKTKRGEKNSLGLSGNNKVIPENEENKRIKVILVAVMKEVSRRYEEVLVKNNFDISNLEIDCFSIKRSLVGNDLGNYLVMDIGEKTSSIIIVSRGNLVLNRNIDVAGSKITEVISRGIKVDLQKANELKKKFGMEIDSKFNIKLVEPVASMIVSEITKAQDMFVKEYPKLKIDGIVLTGGISQMIGFRQYIEQSTGIKSIVGNPWSKIAYPKSIENNLFSYGSVFSVAVGLAMLGFENN